ncbi:ABC-type transporter, integral membrane subunit [Spirochaeta thermophila DSM 6578]|uniref:Xylose transport system permease protein XylH n=1 Tax=Winmispira thermophila (strain ATCC 700085 / DSM 6578 / Z-1203) TaxID=869211 RepID=G0GDW3_WINT7|nr:sugar ABC transporter permease [Spirochaeta thermophila]AEJ60595.1 ABC-type transporter, integral membrane subunit [Spirochaeta thermophila DSM 6578]
MNDLMNRLKRAVQVNAKTYTMIIALLLIWFLFGVLTGGIFFSPRNLSNLFRQMTIISFLATGMVLVIVLGNIDLSVGSVTGFISAVTAFLQARVLANILPSLFPSLPQGTIGILSTAIAIAVALLVGIVIGLFQGSLIAYGGIPAFIVTLGGMLIFRGGVLGVTEGKTIVPVEDSLVYIAQGYLSPVVGLVLAAVVVVLIFLSTLTSRRKKVEYGFEVPPLWKDLAKAGFFSFLVILYVVLMNMYRGVQLPVLLLAVVALIISYVANNTRFGRYVYAVGGNREATRLSGINIRKTVFQVHVLMGLLAGVAGVVLTGYVAAGTVNGGINYELDTIASCVIGGTSLMGGEGTIFGALVGSLIMASIVNGMSVMNMPIFWQYVTRGLVLIIAVYLDVASKRRRE